MSKKPRQGDFLKTVARAEELKKARAHQTPRKEFTWKEPIVKTKPIKSVNFNNQVKPEKGQKNFSHELNNLVDSVSERALGYKK